MFSKTAALFDLIYGQFKDYAAESRAVAGIQRELHPGAERVLDVACGTGEHARSLAEVHGYHVDGLDMEPEFVRIAQEKCPRGEFFCADMLDFSLGRSYDAILCLFSSIGYARTYENVVRVLRRLREHLASGGVVIVEPWFGPETWTEGMVHARLVETETLKVSRMSHSVVRGGISVLSFHYLIGGAEGVEHRHEVHELGLFTPQEMSEAFAEAGLSVVRYDPEGLTGRGLFVATAAG